MSIPLLIGSVLGVLGLAAAAYWLGLGGGTIAGAEEARCIAEEALPGFAAGEAFVSTDRRSALVLGHAGDAALLKLQGVHPAVRHLRLPLATERLPEGLRIMTGERMFGSVQLRLPAEQQDKLLTLL